LATEMTVFKNAAPLINRYQMLYATVQI